MYDVILVPLDGSKRAEAILRHVEEIAQRFDAKVIFLQVVEPTPPTQTLGPLGDIGLYQENLEEQIELAESYLSTLRGEFREKGIEARTHVAYGTVVETIVNAAQRESADLIAMASHGRSGLSRVFYGSVAAGVLHRVDRPLLLIRSQGDE